VPALRAAIAGVNGGIDDVFARAFSLGRERRGGRAAPLYRTGMGPLAVTPRDGRWLSNENSCPSYYCYYRQLD
jgi:hypothetical protein